MAFHRRWRASGNYQVAEANAALIAEAGTVRNETGLSPRELAEHRKGLLDALIELRKWQGPGSASSLGAKCDVLTDAQDQADAAIAKALG